MLQLRRSPRGRKEGLNESEIRLKSLKKTPYYGWWIAIACLLVTFSNGGLFWIYGVFFTPMALEFGWSRGGLSGATSAFLLSYALGAILLGRVADRTGPRPVLLMSALLLGAAYLGCSRIQSLPALIFYYSLIGLGTSVTLTLPAATIQRWFLKWRGLMMGVSFAGSGVGSLIFNPLANHLITQYGWRMAYVILGVWFGSLITLGASLMIHSPEKKNLKPYGWEQWNRKESLGHTSPNEAGLATGQALRTEAFRSLVALRILTFAPMSFFITHLVPYGIDRGISTAAAARAMGLMGASAIPGRIIMGASGDRFGWMKGIAVSNSIAAAAILWLILTGETWMLYLFVMAFGFSNGGSMTMQSGAVSFFFGYVSLTELLGLTMAMGLAAGAVVPVLGGLAFDWLGSYVPVLVSASALTMAGGAYAAYIDRRLYNRPGGYAGPGAGGPVG